MKFLIGISYLDAIIDLVILFKRYISIHISFMMLNFSLDFYAVSHGLDRQKFFIGILLQVRRYFRYLNLFL